MRSASVRRAARLGQAGQAFRRVGVAVVRDQRAARCIRAFAQLLGLRAAAFSSVAQCLVQVVFALAAVLQGVRCFGRHHVRQGAQLAANGVPEALACCRAFLFQRGQCGLRERKTDHSNWAGASSSAPCMGAFFFLQRQRRDLAGQFQQGCQATQRGVQRGKTHGERGTAMFRRGRSGTVARTATVRLVVAGKQGCRDRYAKQGQGARELRAWVFCPAFSVRRPQWPGRTGFRPGAAVRRFMCAWACCTVAALLRREAGRNTC